MSQHSTDTEPVLGRRRVPAAGVEWIRCTCDRRPGAVLLKLLDMLVEGDLTQPEREDLGGIPKGGEE